MSLTASGPFLLLALLLVFTFTPTRLSQAVVFFAPFTATAIANATSISYGLTPAYFALLLFLAGSLLHGRAFKRVEVSADHLIQVMLLCTFVVAVLISLGVNGLETRITVNQITQTAYLLCGVAATIFLSFDFLRPGQLERVMTTLLYSGLFVCAWAIVQGVCYYAHIPYPAVIFNNSASHFADMFEQEAGGIVRLASVAVEPSIMVFSLLHFAAFASTILVMEPRLRSRGWLFATAATIAIILLSTSTTGYFGLFLLVILLGLRRPVQAIIGLFGFCVAAAGVLIAFSSFRHVVYDMTFNKTASYSYNERITAMHDAYQFFYNHPLLGAGWGSATPADLFGTLLGNTGVFGTTMFCTALLATIFGLHAARRAAAGQPQTLLMAYAAGAQNAMLVSVGVSMISGMKYFFLDDWCYWAVAISTASQLLLQARRHPIRQARRIGVGKEAVLF
jgi:hypothetical protein